VWRDVHHADPRAGHAMRLWGRAFQRTNRASTKNLLLGFETTRPSVIMLTSHKFLRLKGGDFCSPVGRPRCGLPRQPLHELMFLSCSIARPHIHQKSLPGASSNATTLGCVGFSQFSTSEKGGFLQLGGTSIAQVLALDTP